MAGGRHELAQCLLSHSVLSRFVETWAGVSPLFGVTSSTQLLSVSVCGGGWLGVNHVGFHLMTQDCVG